MYFGLNFGFYEHMMSVTIKTLGFEKIYITLGFSYVRFQTTIFIIDLL